MILSGPNEYVAQRVLSATPTELVRILYEGAVQAVDQAMAALNTGDILGRGRAVTKAIEILSELRASLRHDVSQSYCNTLDELYGYMQRQLIRAHAERSESLLREVSRLLITLQDGWSRAMDQLAAPVGPVDHPSQGEELELVTASNPYSLPMGSRSENRSWQL